MPTQVTKKIDFTGKQLFVGLDVHKKSVTACRIVADGKGGWRREIKKFGTKTPELLELSDWLTAEHISHVAMESTGVYWKPIFNILESHFEVLVVNAKHIKHVPGRKTDVRDAEWIAELLQHGLLKASYIPDEPQRDLRELVRYRTHLLQERTREVNRVHKMLEDANLKLSNVASDIMGVSGRAMLRAIVAGKDNPAALADLAKGRLRSKIDELEKALTGHVRQCHRLLLRMHLEHIDELNEKIEELNHEISLLIRPFDQENLVERLDAITGVGQKTIDVVIAEIGTDMSRFPSHRLCLWLDAVSVAGVGHLGRGDPAGGSLWQRVGRSSLASPDPADQDAAGRRNPGCDPASDQLVHRRPRLSDRHRPAVLHQRNR